MPHNAPSTRAKGATVDFWKKHSISPNKIAPQDVTAVKAKDSKDARKMTQSEKDDMSIFEKDELRSARITLGKDGNVKYGKWQRGI